MYLRKVTNLVFLLSILLVLSFYTKAQTPTSPPPNLVGFWTGDGNANDIVSTNNGTLQNGAGFAVGKVGQGFNFDGTDDFVRIPKTPLLNFGTGDFSVEFWVKFNDLSGWNGMMSGDNFGETGDYNGWLFNRDDSGGGIGFLTRRASIGTTHARISASNFSNGVWYHIAGIRNGRILSLYVNGVLSASGTESTAIDVSNSYEVRIGSLSTTIPQHINGQIDEVSLYNRALTPVEITSIFNSGIAGKTKQVTTISTANRAALWQAEGNGNDFTSTNNGTLFNGTSFVNGKIGRAFDFVRSSNQYVEIPDSPSVSPTTQITTAAWVKLASDNDQSVIGKYGTSSVTVQNSFFHGFYSGRIFVFCVYASGYYCRTANSPIPLNQWIHTAATFDTVTQEMKLFINGVEIPSTVISTSSIPTINDSTTPVRISGNPESYPDDFDGQIDEATIFSRVLSPTEIQAIYQQGNGSLGDATVTFQNVTTAGITEQIPLDLSTLPSLPSGSTATGLAYDISTTAVYTGSPQVCFNLPSFTNSVVFNNLRILHLEGGIWQNRTDILSIDFASKTICTTGLNSLSPFAVVNGFAPTAANATISGRVQTANGRGISNVTVELTNLLNGETRTVRTNNFGRYSFTDLETGQNSLLSVTAKRFTFTNSSRLITLNESLSDADFIAN